MDSPISAKAGVSSAFPAVAFNLARHFRGEVLTRVVIERHVGAFTREHFTERRANPTRPTGDERALTF